MALVKIKKTKRIFSIYDMFLEKGRRYSLRKAPLTYLIGDKVCKFVQTKVMQGHHTYQSKKWLVTLKIENI